MCIFIPVYQTYSCIFLHLLFKISISIVRGALSMNKAEGWGSAGLSDVALSHNLRKHKPAYCTHSILNYLQPHTALSAILNTFCTCVSSSTSPYSVPFKV